MFGICELIVNSPKNGAIDRRANGELLHEWFGNSIGCLKSEYEFLP